MAITLRATKGAELTHNELDANFTSFQESSGSSLVGFIQSGTGAVARTLQSAERAVARSGDFDTVANFNTAVSALTETFGVSSLRSLGNIQFVNNSGQGLLFGTRTSFLPNASSAGMTVRAQDTGLGPIVFSILDPTTTGGAREIGNVNFESVNGGGIAYRVGWMYGKQINNGAGAERGKLTFETIWDSTTTEHLVIGDQDVSAVQIKHTGTQLVCQYSDTARLFLFHNNTNGYVGTSTNHPLILRTNNTDKLILAANGTLTHSGSVQAGFGVTPTAARVHIQDSSIQLVAQFDATNQLILFHNGTNGYIGTLTNQPVILRSNNTDAITISTAQAVSAVASVTAHSGTAIPAGGTAGSGLLVSSTANFGVFFGSGAPTLTAAQGSLYLRSDGSSTSTRAYINNSAGSGTTWTAITTAA